MVKMLEDSSIKKFRETFMPGHWSPSFIAEYKEGHPYSGSGEKKSLKGRKKRKNECGKRKKWIKSGHEKKGKLKEGREGRRKRKEGRLIIIKKKQREDERKKVKTRWR